MKLRIAYIGCVDFSYSALSHLKSLEYAEIVGVVTKPVSSFNSDFKSLDTLAKDISCPCFYANNASMDELKDFLISVKADVIYCFGWSSLLSTEVLTSSKHGVVGFHPAALPKNRGRHPIIWALALGLKQTASTFFWMDEGADSGPLIAQQLIQISDDDDAKKLYSKIQTVALTQIETFTKNLSNGIKTTILQDHDQANYWRKRSKSDGLIDWRMSSKSIYNLVRALTSPYVGAHCLYHGEDIKIWKVSHCATQDTNIEPGKVIDILDQTITVQATEGIVKILKHQFTSLPKVGDYLC